VFAHETGHIFGCPDEYASSNCNCGGTWGRFGIANGNCENCASGGGVQCLMKGNTFAVCGYTPSHLGWAPQLLVRNYGYNAGGWRVEQHPRILADTTGDGRADIIGFGNAGVYISRAMSDGRFETPVLVVNNFGYTAGGWRVDKHPRFLVDLTGDGRADIVGFGNAGMYVSLNNGNGTFQNPVLAVANFGYNAGGWRVEMHPRFLADLTGDGRADVVGFGNAGVWVALNNGNGTFQAPQLVVANFGYNAGGWRVEKHPRFLADLTGDGRADIVGFGDAGVWVSLNNGNGTFQSPVLAVANFGYNAGGWRLDMHPRLLADVSGDGRADIIGFGNDGVWVSRNNGNGTFQGPQLLVNNFGYNAGGWRVDQHPRFLADTTGDGRADIVGFGNAGVYVSRLLANGSFEPPGLVITNFGYNAGGWRVDQHPRILADTTGDGRADIVGFGNAGVYVSRS
jgi:FG-GAP-like repeat